VTVSGSGMWFWKRVPESIQSAESVGSVISGIVRLVDSVPSGERMGRLGNYAVGIESLESIGSVDRSMLYKISVSGIQSRESVGDAGCYVGRLFVYASGISSGSAFGTPSTRGHLLVTSVDVISSDEGFGYITINLTLIMFGISSGESIGSPSRTATVSRTASSISSGEDIGEPNDSGSSINMVI
jgi:hypothetical protein